MPPGAPAGFAHPAVVLVGGSGPDRSRRDGRGDPDLRAARESARRQRLHRPALRQARRRPERRPHRNRDARRLRRRRGRRRQMAGEAQRRGSAADRRRGGPQRGRRGRADGRGARKEDRRRRRASPPPARPGADLILRATAASARRHEAAGRGAGRRKIDLQKKIQAAVISGTGWEGVPDELRKQADTPWFQSLLHVRSREGHAEGQAADSHRPGRSRYAGAAGPRRQARRAGARAQEGAGRSRSVHIPDINHLLVPATTGEVQEYGQLPGTHDQPRSVARRSPSWVKKSCLSWESTRLLPMKVGVPQGNLAGRDAGRADSGRRRGAQESRPRGRRRAATPGAAAGFPDDAYEQAGRVDRVARRRVRDGRHPAAGPLGACRTRRCCGRDRSSSASPIRSARRDAIRALAAARRRPRSRWS